MFKVLLADDHAIIRDGLRRIIEEETTMKVVGEAENGVKALEAAQKAHPDLIILDISMPEMDGFDCVRYLRKLVPKTKILVLTMHDSLQYAIRTLEAGAHGFLLKDSASKELITAMRTVLDGRAYMCPQASEKMAEQYRMKRSGVKLLSALSSREFQVLRHFSSGHSLKQTAEAMCISEKTVSTYRSRILDKLGLNTTADLSRYALEERILE